jgi:hypothetical protein
MIYLSVILAILASVIVGFILGFRLVIWLMIYDDCRLIRDLIDEAPAVRRIVARHLNKQ